MTTQSVINKSTNTITCECNLTGQSVACAVDHYRQNKVQPKQTRTTKDPTQRQLNFTPARGSQEGARPKHQIGDKTINTAKEVKGSKSKEIKERQGSDLHKEQNQTVNSLNFSMTDPTVPDNEDAFSKS